MADLKKANRRDWATGKVDEDELAALNKLVRKMADGRFDVDDEATRQ